jgi:hypothetical protein
MHSSRRNLPANLEHHASMPKADNMSDICYLAYLDVEGREMYEKRGPNIAQDDWHLDQAVERRRNIALLSWGTLG